VTEREKKDARKNGIIFLRKEKKSEEVKFGMREKKLLHGAC